MARYFLRELDRLRFEQRARWSFVSEAAKPGQLRLYNKNAFATLHLPIVEQCEDRYGWIVECESVPRYFRHVLQPTEG